MKSENEQASIGNHCASPSSSGMPNNFFHPLTPVYNYSPYDRNVSGMGNPSVSEFEKLVLEINSKYSPTVLSNPFGMLLATPQTPQQYGHHAKSLVISSPPATPGNRTEKSFPCMEINCGKQFNSKQSLKSHMTIHADDKIKPFDCSICGSSFRRKHDLTRHYRSLHAPIKPFKCKFCNREYARSDALKRHLQSKAHSLPVELTNIVAAASRQTGFTDSANFL